MQQLNWGMAGNGEARPRLDISRTPPQLMYDAQVAHGCDVSSSTLCDDPRLLLPSHGDEASRASLENAAGSFNRERSALLGWPCSYDARQTTTWPRCGGGCLHGSSNLAVLVTQHPCAGHGTYLHGVKGEKGG